MPIPATVARPWLAAYPPGVPAEYRWPDVALPRLLDDAARDFGDVDAVRHGTHAWTWEQVRSRTDALAGALQQGGVGPGDRVALALPNGPAAAVVAFASWRVGAVVVLLDPDLPAPDRADTLAATAPRLVFADAGHAADWEDAPTVLVVTDPTDWVVPGRLARLSARVRHRVGRARPAADVPGARTWAELHADAPTPSHPALDPGDLAVLSPSGRTTGQRRIVALTHRNLVVNAFQARLWVPDVQAGREVILAAVPFTNLFGLTAGLLAGTLSAATLVVPEGNDGRALAGAIATDRPTLFPAVAAAVRAVVDAADERRTDLSSLRVCLVGGPLPTGVAARFRALSGQARLREGYGLSEAGPLTHANPVYGRAEPGRVGLPVTGTVAIVVDPDDPSRMLPDGTTGRLAIAGPQVMAGYWQDPDATAAVLRDGWLITGQLAVRDATGSFALVDGRVDGVRSAGVRSAPGHDQEVAG